MRIRNILKKVSNITFFILLLPLTCWGQNPDRKVEEFDKFEHFLKSNRTKAAEIAKEIDSNRDSVKMELRSLQLYTFLAEYSEFYEFRYSEALDYITFAKQIANSIKVKERIDDLTAAQGRIYLKIGDYHNAFTHSTQALMEANRENDRITAREALLTLEVVNYFYNKDTTSIMDINRSVAQSYTCEAEAKQTLRALNNRFHYNPSLADVEKIVLESEQICKEYPSNELLINTYLNASMQYIPYEDMERCRYYLEKARPLVTNFKEEGYFYSALGFYYINMQEYDNAIDATKKSIELLSSGDFDEKNVHSYFLLQELYKMQHEYEKAYQALMAFAEIYTRQNNSEYVVELSRLINELELLNKEELISKQRGLNILLIIIVFLASVSFVALILFFRSKKKLQEERTQHELNHKNEIIKVQKLQQYQEQRNMSEIVTELTQAINLGNSQQMRSEINRIILRLQKGSDTGSDWNEVETMLSARGNDQFYENLIKAYPNLTKNERKLCTFIHLNLSTKEISKITHQSIGSINIARSRLRHKFGINGDERSLITFLDQFSNTEN